ncbi:hypothetical protein [uncultured Arcticibacterium sp.]|uniref:hypothetical protein n=1 Tax=uncultured Arcticibacterium sp. TaxID=2173042 RepID=UPI0030FC486C
MHNAFSWAFVLSTTENFDFLTTEEKDLLFKYYEDCKSFSKLDESASENEKEQAYEFLVNELIGDLKKDETGQDVLTKVLNTKTLIEFLRFRFPTLDSHYETIYQEEFGFFKDSYIFKAKKGINHSKIVEQAHENFALDSPLLMCQKLNKISANKFSEIFNNIEKHSFNLDKILGNHKASTLSELDNPFSKDLTELLSNYDQKEESYIQVLSDERYTGIDEQMEKFLEKYTRYLLDAYHNESFHCAVENYTPKEEIVKSKEFTLNRQVIAINLLLTSAKCTNIDNTVKAEFIQFLTSKNLNSSKIKDSEIYRKLNANSLNKKDKEFLINHFELLNGEHIIDKIKNFKMLGG